MMVMRSFFVSSRDELLLASSLLDREEHGFITPIVPHLFQDIEGLLIILGQLQVFLEGAVVQNGTDEVVLTDVSHLVFSLGDVGDLDGGSSGGSIFVLLVGEDVDADNGGLGGSVLSWLGSGVLGNLAGMSLEHAVASLLDGASLCGFTVG